MARPSKYKPEFARLAQKMAKLGATDIEIADAIEIDIATFYRWSASNKEFCEAKKLGKKESDERVERSLYMRATGYSHPDTHISVHEGAVTATPITKHYPPDATSMIFWLKNRKPKEWRDKQDVEHSGNVEIRKVERVIVGK